MNIILQFILYLKDKPYHTDFRETKSMFLLRDLNKFKQYITHEEFQKIESFIRTYFISLLNSSFGSINNFIKENSVSDTLQISLTKNFSFLDEDLLFLFSSVEFSTSDFYQKLYEYLTN